MSTDKKRHALVDAVRPNFLEEVFPYDLPPLIRLKGPVVETIDGQSVQFDFGAVRSRPIVITDTTFRDGQQSRPPYTIEQMVHIYDLLSRLGEPHDIKKKKQYTN